MKNGGSGGPFLCMGRKDRSDGTRLVIRLYHWGFSKTILKRGENGEWVTLSHSEYRFNQELRE